MSIKNVILLTIDGLRYDRLGYVSGLSEKTPTIDYLANNGISCSNNFSHGCPTQMSMPSMFTSSLPLDYGGYDDIKERPITLAEILRDNGFNTIGITNGSSTSSYYGYDRGFNQFYEMFSHDSVWFSIRKLYFSYFNKMKESGEFSIIEYHNKCAKNLDSFFNYIISNKRNLNYLNSLNQEINSNISKHSTLYDKNVLNLYDQFTNEPEDFVDINKNMFNLLSNRYSQKVSNFEFMKFIQGYNSKKLRLQPSSWINILLSHKINKWFGNYFRLNDQKQTLKNDRDMTDNIIRSINKNSEQRFFIWAHYMSVHDKVYNSNSIFQMPQFNIQKNNIIHPDSCPYYDLSINAVDQLINKLLDAMRKKQIIKDTLIVLTSDHGHSAGSPNRGVGLGSTPLYDEFIHVPLIFYNPELQPTRIDDICDLMDIPPTILKLLNIESPDVFKGESILDSNKKKKKYVLSEHAGRGPCDLKNKPLKISVRTSKFKLIISQSVNNKHHKFPLNELYDIKSDMYETSNLYSDPNYVSVKNNLEQIAYNRINEVKNHYQDYS